MLQLWYIGTVCVGGYVCVCVCVCVCVRVRACVRDGATAMLQCLCTQTDVQNFDSRHWHGSSS